MHNGGAILLAEDNPDDVQLLRLALRKAGISNPLIVLPDGEQAIQYLAGEGPYEDREQYPLPSLILLDLIMPSVSGFEVLAWLRQQPDLKHLPVVVLTSWTVSPDVTKAYQLGANALLIKPVELNDLVASVKRMADFWLGQCRLPELSPAMASLMSRASPVLPS
ncbi:MAG TPA: response regulator [Clostridia bacterium]|nr:response regulator [Clostridia bacterium]